LRIPAIEIATREPLAGRLPPQAKARASALADAGGNARQRRFQSSDFYPNAGERKFMENSVENTTDGG
jgi:hypothetical protein